MYCSVICIFHCFHPSFLQVPKAQIGLTMNSGLCLCFGLSLKHKHPLPGFTEIRRSLSAALAREGFQRRCGTACRDKINRIRAQYRTIIDKNKRSVGGREDDDPFWFPIKNNTMYNTRNSGSRRFIFRKPSKRCTCTNDRALAPAAAKI